MKIMVTGAGGFIGKHLVYALQNLTNLEVLPYHSSCDLSIFRKYINECDWMIHLAGVNRTDRDDEFQLVNVDFTQKLLDNLSECNNPCPIIFASSIHAANNTPYGYSKRKAEKLIFEYKKNMKTKVFVYRLPNVFGKWCRPNYNSVVANFCYNQTHGLPLQIHNAGHVVELSFIDDVISEFISAISDEPHRRDDYCYIPITYKKTVGELADLISSFDESHHKLLLPNLSDDFTRKLYSTYLSYLPEDEIKYPLLSHKDNRGSFTEFLRTKGQGQISVNITRPNVIKGNHWHFSKHEKFLVVSGEGVIRLRDVRSKENIIEYNVSGDILEVVDIPPGYVHNIENTGNEDMVTVIWANECFRPDCPDTYAEDV